MVEQNIRRGWNLTVDSIPRPKPSVRERIKKAKETASGALAATAKNVKRPTVVLASTWNAVLATPVAHQIDSWLGHAFAGTATGYDKAMDAIYNATHVGGHWHRLVDGNHDLAGAWQAISNAYPDDPLLQQISGYVAAVWKDMVTPDGIPVVSISPDNLHVFHRLGESIGVGHTWINDMLGYTATELTGAITGVVAIVLNLQQDDKSRLAALTGSLGVSALVGANPLLGIITIIALGKTLRNARDDTGIHIAKGSLGSAAFLAASSLLVGHVWLGLMAGVVASMLVHHASGFAIERFRSQDWSTFRQAWDRKIAFLAAKRVTLYLPKPAT